MKEGINLIVIENLNNYQLNEYIIDLFYNNLSLNEGKDIIIAKNRLNRNYDIDNNKIMKQVQYNMNAHERRNFLNSLYSETMPIFENLVNESLHKYMTVSTFNTKYRTSNCITMVDDYFSFAGYVDISLNLPTYTELKMSPEMYSLLGLNMFVIRFANHISKKELPLLLDKSNLKMGMIYAIDTQENIIKRFISNIIKSRNELMASILTSEHPILTIEDIDKSVLDRALKFKKQGKF